MSTVIKDIQATRQSVPAGQVIICCSFDVVVSRPAALFA